MIPWWAAVIIGVASLAIGAGGACLVIWVLTCEYENAQREAKQEQISGTWERA